MLRIRLTRTGRKNLSHFRIVVAQKEAPIKGRFIEILGAFDPKIDDRKKAININEERLKYWQSVGAKPTDTVTNILVDAGILDAKFRIKKTSKKKVKGKEEKPEKPAVIETPQAPQVQEGSAMEIPAEEAKPDEEETFPEKTPKAAGKEVEKPADEKTVPKENEKAPQKKA